MPVPSEIRQIERPINTVVCDSGRLGPKRYIVRSRVGVKYVKGKNPQPKNGPVIGYIFEGKFIPKFNRCASEGPSTLSFGSSVFVHNLATDLIDDLLAVMDIKDAVMTITVAQLRVAFPGLKQGRISTRYEESWIQKFHPGIGLTRGTVKDLMKRIGQDDKVRREFFEKRFARICAEHHVAIDGTLKQDTSTTNSLSAYSRKARVRGCKEISILYAYDIETMEPICAQVFPGNSIDAASYRQFIRTNKITHGIIVADKGFPPREIAEELKENKDLHFLTPIKRNDTRIRKYEMTKFENVLDGLEKTVLYKKVAIENGRFLYAYQDVEKNGYLKRNYIERKKREGNFDTEELRNEEEMFGTIIFESDQDVDPATIYRSYQDRWLLELVFRFYKNDEELTETNVQGDATVIGSEFINFISTVITCRAVEKMEKSGLLKEYSYSEIMAALAGVWRKVDAPEVASTADDGWINRIKWRMEIMEALGLSVPAPKPVKRKPGRPRKNPSPKAEKPKRPRGRPRKIKAEEPEISTPKKRGRPRKHPNEPNPVKRPRGRPRKNHPLS